MGPVQKRVNRAGPNAIYEKPAFQVGPWLVSKNLDSGRVPSIPS